MEFVSRSNFVPLLQLIKDEEVNDIGFCSIMFALVLNFQIPMQFYAQQSQNMPAYGTSLPQ